MAEHRILVGSAGTATAFGIVRSVKSLWDYQVFVLTCDINPEWLVAASKFADAFESISPAESESFIADLISLIRRYDIDTYVPVHDREIEVASSLHDSDLLGNPFWLIAPSRAAAETCNDKLKTYETLSHQGLPAARTELPTTASWNPTGLCAKPRIGVGSVGVRTLESESELAAIAASGEDLVVQERCRAPEITLDVMRSRVSTSFRAVCRERIQTKAGVSTKSRIFEDEALADLAFQVSDALELRGAFCFQVMRAADSDEWLITDVNPRTGGGTRMCAAVGLNFPGANLADAWGQPFDHLLPRLDASRVVVRQFKEYVMR